MSKILFVCLRDAARAGAMADAVTTACRRLQPDNLRPSAPQVLRSGNVVIGVSNPTPVLSIDRRAILAGNVVGGGAWQACRAGRPDGSYALVRADDRHVEAISDSLGSRSLWYVLTDSAFIVSTSQRAISCLLGDFEFNPDVVPWLLACGNLGPGHAWDRRVRGVPASTIVSLDLRTWRLSQAVETHREQPGTPAADADPERRLRNELNRTFGGLQVDDSRWAITLSGGIDCRAILCSLPTRNQLRAVTWGLQSALDDPTNDAFIARQLAKHFGMRHDFFPLELSDEPVDRILDRFLACGEGRIDHLSGYADGFRLWQRLAADGIHGVLRGDEVFGRDPTYSPWQARKMNELYFWSDFADLPALETMGLRPQVLPAAQRQRDDETLAEWCDRSHREYRVPVVNAALNDLKLAYVEVANPLLSDGLVRVAQQLPARLRRSKSLFHKIVASMGPDIPFATNIAIQEGTSILRSARFVELLQDGLDGPLSPEVPQDLAVFARQRLATSTAAPRVRRRLRVPPAIRAISSGLLGRIRARSSAAARLDPNRLAFRVLLLSQALRMYRADAASRQAAVTRDAARRAYAGDALRGHA
jgi:asparagine synthetase B (glutamine-hydrolysing)